VNNYPYEEAAREPPLSMEVTTSCYHSHRKGRKKPPITTSKIEETATVMGYT
jgi:hypothetical protein